MTIEEDFNKQTQAAKMKFSTSLEDSPDDAARALDLEKHTNWPATSTAGDIDAYEGTYKAQVGQHLIDNNPVLQDFINSHPLNAGLINDDLGNLDGLSEALKKLPKDPVDEFFKGFYRGFDFESDVGAWQQNYPEWKALQDQGSAVSAAAGVAGLPIELPSRIFSGLIEGGKSALEAGHMLLGGTEQQAQKFSRDMAGLIETNLMGLGGTHKAALPQETIKTLEDFEKTRVWAEAGKTPPVGVSSLLDKMRAEQTRQDLKNLDEVVKLAQGTALHERHLPSLMDFIRLHPEIKDESVYISGEAVKKIYGDKQPEVDDNLLGWVSEIQNQLATGGDVAIPLDLWATKIEGELAKELKDYTKLRPDGLTLDEIGEKPKVEEPTEEEPLTPLMQAVQGYRRAMGIDIPRESIGGSKIVSAQIAPTSVWDEKGSAFIEKMDRLLSKLAPRMVQGMHAEDIRFDGSKAHGAYIPRKDALPIIAWSTSKDAAHTIRHEVIHHLNRYGFFTDSEWGTLVAEAEDKGWIAQHSIDFRYAKEDENVKLEESIAEEFAKWATYRSNAHPLAKIFNKIWDFIQGMYAALKETFGQELSAEDIFRKVEKGEIGAREDNEPVMEGVFNPAAQKEEDAAFQKKHDEEQVKKQSSKEWKDAASAVRGDAENAILGRPDVQADKFLREQGGRRWANSVLDQIAEQFGYQTRNEMMDAVYDLRQDRGAQPPDEYLERLITDETNRRVGKKLNDPGALLESAKDHVISASATDLQYELARIVAAKTKEKLPSKKEMKQTAADLVAGMPMKAINSDRFLADAGRTTRVKDNLQSRKDQLISIYKAQEARKYEKAKESYEGIVRAHSGLKPRDIDIPHGLFIQQSLARMGEKIKRTPEDLAEEIAKNESGYKDINAFEQGKNSTEFKSINIGENLRKPDFTGEADKLTGENFLDVLKGLRSLVKSGRQDYKIELRGQNADAADVIGKISEQLAKQGEKKIVTNPGKIRKITGLGKTLTLGLRQVEWLIDAIEKGDPFGYFTQAVIEPIYRVSGILDKHLKEGSEVIKELPAKDLEEKTGNNLIIEPDTRSMISGPQFKDLRGKNLLAFILNMGEEGNKKALLEGYGISEERALAWIDQHATKEMMESAKQIWEWQKDIKKQRDEMFRREGDWVEPQARPVEIKTKHGVYEGGGVPLLYDARYEKSKILGPGAIEGASYIRAQMRPTEPLPVSLDFERLIMHTSGAIRDLSLRPALRQVARIFRDEDFRKAVRNHLGDEYNNLFDKWLFDIANQRNVDTKVQSALSNVSDFARTSLASYLIGFNLNTVQKHGITAGLQSIGRSIETQGLIKGPINFMKDFGTQLFSKEFAKEFSLMHLNPDLGDGNIRFAMEASYELPRRLHGWAENIGGATQELIQGRSVRQWIIGLGSKPIAIADLSTATALFISEFRAAQEKGLSKGDSVFLADRAVRQAHGSTALFTKPEFMRSSSGSKWMMTFYGFFNHILQRQFEIGWRSAEMRGLVKAGDTASAMKELGTVTNLTFFYVLAPALVEMYVAQELFKSATAKEGLLHRLGVGMATSIAGSWPIARDLAHYVAGYAEPNVGLAGTMLKNIGTPMIDLSKGKVLSTQKATEKFVKDFMVAIGSVTGAVPASGVRAGKFLRDVQKGREKPAGYTEWERGLQTGHAKAKK